jgi:hypothetical protein
LRLELLEDRRLLSAAVLGNRTFLEPAPATDLQPDVEAVLAPQQRELQLVLASRNDSDGAPISASGLAIRTFDRLDEPFLPPGEIVPILPEDVVRPGSTGVIDDATFTDEPTLDDTSTTSPPIRETPPRILLEKLAQNRDARIERFLEAQALRAVLVEAVLLQAAAEGSASSFVEAAPMRPTFMAGAEAGSLHGVLGPSLDFSVQFSEEAGQLTLGAGSCGGPWADLELVAGDVVFGGAGTEEAGTALFETDAVPEGAGLLAETIHVDAAALDAALYQFLASVGDLGVELADILGRVELAVGLTAIMVGVGGWQVGRRSGRRSRRLALVSSSMPTLSLLPQTLSAE